MSLYEDKCFKIIGHRNNYVLVRKGFPYEYHSHFRDLKGAKQVLNLYYRKLVPKSKYYKTSMKRITTKKEYASFGIRKVKQKYKNNTRR